MPKYRVVLKEIEFYSMIVDTENEDDAVDIAWDRLTLSDKDTYWFDSDGDAEVQLI